MAGARSLHLRFDIITIFPSMFDSYLKESILARAQKDRLITIALHDLRDYAADKHHTVDDKPFGGGAGMIMKVEPIFKAIKALRGLKIKDLGLKKSSVVGRRSKVILLSAKGKPFTQEMAKKYAKLNRVIFICGRYEGVDERVAAHIADEEVSIGPYVLTGGELPAMVMIDAISRHVAGVLGNKESLKEESFNEKFENFKSKIENSAKCHEYPQYTRPAVFMPRRGVQWKVPAVLLSGDHRKIEEWRKK
ncbi:MAG: tRNA (guanosine(37)-N1)-methyltransferase TrmD [bacterium]|nr:tRNA (guanosine(37)-N1)-methyltransferase TrmD [bacterium]